MPRASWSTHVMSRRTTHCPHLEQQTWITVLLTGVSLVFPSQSSLPRFPGEGGRRRLAMPGSPTQRLLILSLAFIESLVIYALLVFFMLQGKLAPVADVISKAAGH